MTRRGWAGGAGCVGGVRRPSAGRTGAVGAHRGGLPPGPDPVPAVRRQGRGDRPGGGGAAPAAAVPGPAADAGARRRVHRPEGGGLRSGFRFLARRGFVPDDPAAGLGVPRGPKRLPVVLKPGQVDRLLAGPDPVDPVGLRDRAILELLYATGIRVGELCGLRLGDVDLAADTVLVLGKGAKQRIVPFGEPARVALLDYLVKGRAAMPGRRGRPARPAGAARTAPPTRRRCSSTGGGGR